MNARDRESLYMLRCIMVGITLEFLGLVIVFLAAVAGWGWPIKLGHAVMWCGVAAIFAAGWPALRRALKAHDGGRAGWGGDE